MAANISPNVKKRQEEYVSDNRRCSQMNKKKYPVGLRKRRK
jgi:hypothetical protein